MTDTLADHFALGAGRSIRPPADWIAEGFVNGDDSLKLRPASIVRWSPPGVERLALSWCKSKVMLDPKTSIHFADILRQPMGVVSPEKLRLLFPRVLRIPLFRVTASAVTAFPGTGPMLEIDYFIAEARQAGMVFFAPTERFEAGELQILCYEGTEPGFSQYRSIAIRSINTFSTTGGLARRPTAIVRGGKKNALTKKTGVVRRRSGAGDGDPLTIEYVLQEGETMRSIVKERWPELSVEEQSTKAKEIYALNRARGNPLYAWTLKAGDRIWLPMQ